MAYTPDPENAVEPVSSRFAGGAAAEFRAIKAQLLRMARFPSNDPAVDDLPSALARLDRLQMFDPSTGAPTISNFTATQLASAIAAIAIGGDGSSAETIAFIQAGLDAVPRTVQSYLQDAVHLRDFYNSTTDAGDWKFALERALAKNRPIYVHDGTYSSTTLTLQSGQDVVLIGSGADKVIWNVPVNQQMLHCDASPTVDTRCGNVFISGIHFKGGHVRNKANFPYNSDPGASAIRAFTLRAIKGATDQLDCTITRCKFSDFNGLPLWIAGFDGSVELSYNTFTRCKDPGILYNNRVKIFGNTIRFSADNGISVSRSNRQIFVGYNHLMECASAGLFIGSIQLAGTGTITAVGTAYGVGKEVLLTAAGGAAFTTEDIGTNFTLTGGGQISIVRIKSVSSSTSAVAYCYTAMNAAHQAVASTYERGPISGASGGQVVYNIIEGCRTYNIALTSGCKDLIVASNLCKRAGVMCDSELSTLGGIGSGSDQLKVADVTGFAVNDWIVVAPDYTHQSDFIAKILAIDAGTNTFTLSANAPDTYFDETVYRAYRNTAAYGILANGRYLPGGTEYAENLEIVNNIIIDFVNGGMRLGTSTGSIRDSTIAHNQIWIRQTAQLDVSNIFGILIGDCNQASMRTSKLDVLENVISLDGVLGVGIEYRPMDTNAASYIRIDGNRPRQCLVNTRVVEQAGLTNITQAYMPRTLRVALPVADVLAVESIGFATWDPATMNAGVLTVKQTANSYSPTTNPQAMTAIDFSQIMHPNPYITIRNASSANGLQVVHSTGATGIRCKGGATYTIPPLGAATFMPINAGLVQEV